MGQDETRRDETREEDCQSLLLPEMPRASPDPVYAAIVCALVSVGIGIGIGIRKGTVRAFSTSTLGDLCFLCRVLSCIFSSPARGAAKKEGLPVVSVRHGPSAT